MAEYRCVRLYKVWRDRAGLSQPTQQPFKIFQTGVTRERPRGFRAEVIQPEGSAQNTGTVHSRRSSTKAGVIGKAPAVPLYLVVTVLACA